MMRRRNLGSTFVTSEHETPSQAWASRYGLIPEIIWVLNQETSQFELFRMTFIY